MPGTLTIFSHRVTVVRVLGSKFLLYHFGRNTTGTLIEPVYPIKEPVSLSPWRFTGISDMNWNRKHAELPQCAEKIKVKVKLPGEKKEIYAVTPDSEIQEPTALHYEAKTGEDQRQEITFELERLSVFSVVYLRLE